MAIPSPEEVAEQPIKCLALFFAPSTNEIVDLKEILGESYKTHLGAQ